MGITDETILQLIEEYAEALMPPTEIAILLNLPPNQRNSFAVRCLEDVGTPIYEAYQRGRLTTKFALRQNVIKLALAGSPTAEPIAQRFIAEKQH